MIQMLFKFDCQYMLSTTHMWLLNTLNVCQFKKEIDFLLYFILTNLNETNKQTTLSWLMATILDSGDLEDKLTAPH